MNTAFKNILIPVDFSINTEIAVKKAMELVDRSGAAIHLMHVLPTVFPVLSVYPYFPVHSFSGRTGAQDAWKKLTEWKTCIEETSPGVTVLVHIVKGNWVQAQIAEQAKNTGSAIIIIGKHKAHNRLRFLNTVSPGKLALATHCPVLTVKTGSLHNKIKSIVFPVNERVPPRKIDLLITLSLKYRARIYLVMASGSPDQRSNTPYTHFVETYRLLKNGLNCPIEPIMVPGPSLKKSALRFAQSVKADMLLVTPDAHHLPGLMAGPQISDLVKGDSKLEVLSVT